MRNPTLYLSVHIRRVVGGVCEKPYTLDVHIRRVVGGVCERPYREYHSSPRGSLSHGAQVGYLHMVCTVAPLIDGSPNA